MQLTDGAHVLHPEGHEIGRISRIVLNPKTRKVTHVVLHQGIIFPEDRVVPLQSIDNTVPDYVFLRGDQIDLQNLPKFEEVEYVLATEEAVPMEPIPTAGGFLQSSAASGAGQRYSETTRQNIPDQTMALKTNARVMSEDDQLVGHMSCAFVDTGTKIVTHIIVVQGFLLQSHRRVPAFWCKFLTEDEVFIPVDAEALKALPMYNFS